MKCYYGNYVQDNGKVTEGVMMIEDKKNGSKIKYSCSLKTKRLDER